MSHWAQRVLKVPNCKPIGSEEEDGKAERSGHSGAPTTLSYSVRTGDLIDSAELWKEPAHSQVFPWGSGRPWLLQVQQDTCLNVPVAITVTLRSPERHQSYTISVPTRRLTPTRLSGRVSSIIIFEGPTIGEAKVLEGTISRWMKKDSSVQWTEAEETKHPMFQAETPCKTVMGVVQGGEEPWFLERFVKHCKVLQSTQADQAEAAE